MCVFIIYHLQYIDYLSMSPPWSSKQMQTLSLLFRADGVEGVKKFATALVADGGFATLLVGEPSSGHETRRSSVWVQTNAPLQWQVCYLTMRTRCRCVDLLSETRCSHTGLPSTVGTLNQCPLLFFWVLAFLSFALATIFFSHERCSLREFPLRALSISARHVTPADVHVHLDMMTYCYLYVMTILLWRLKSAMTHW